MMSPAATNPRGPVVYLLHFEPSFKHASHYLGWALDVHKRVDEHLSGNGANLVKHAVDAGCHVELVRVWENEDRNFERSLKVTSLHRHCPKCRPAYLQRTREYNKKRRQDWC